MKPFHANTEKAQKWSEWDGGQMKLLASKGHYGWMRAAHRTGTRFPSPCTVQPCRSCTETGRVTKLLVGNCVICSGTRVAGFGLVVRSGSYIKHAHRPHF